MRRGAKGGFGGSEVPERGQETVPVSTWGLPAAKLVNLPLGVT